MIPPITINLGLGDLNRLPEPTRATAALLGILASTSFAEMFVWPVQDGWIGRDEHGFVCSQNPPNRKERRNCHRAGSTPLLRWVTEKATVAEAHRLLGDQLHNMG